MEAAIGHTPAVSRGYCQIEVVVDKFGVMTTQNADYRGYRFPPEIISYAVWLYHRFCLSFRDVEELLANRGVTVSYEAVRQGCVKFGPAFAKQLRHRQGRFGNTWHLDAVVVSIKGKRYYLWRAVDQNGDVLDILVQPHRDQGAAKRFFRKLMKGLRYLPHVIVTDRHCQLVRHTCGVAK
jgi:putative transposase